MNNNGDAFPGREGPLPGECGHPSTPKGVDFLFTRPHHCVLGLVFQIKNEKIKRTY